jgi:hypothetical protein
VRVKIKSFWTVFKKIFFILKKSLYGFNLPQTLTTPTTPTTPTLSVRVVRVCFKKVKSVRVVRV